MKLQTKLLSAFAVTAGITLAIAVLSYWQVNRLGQALYEVGALRLPNMHGLAAMADAVAELETGPEKLNQLPAGADPTEWLEVRRLAWDRFEQGWAQYAPPPQTEEARLWGRYVETAQTWRTQHQAYMDDVLAAWAAGDAAAFRDRLAAGPDDPRLSGRVVGLLSELIALNEAIAEQTKRSSISSMAEVRNTQALMVGAALVAVLSALGLGRWVGHRLSEPITRVATAMRRIAAGERQVALDAATSEEVSAISSSLHDMVGELATSDARLALLGDNLPDSMVYQLERDAGNTPRFVYVSAGVERLHGVSVDQALADADLLYRQILPEDREMLLAAEQRSFADMAVFSVLVRTRHPDGSLRWMQLNSKPRRTASGRVIWDGVEMDVTKLKQLEADHARIAELVDRHFDAVVWTDTDNRFVYVNEAFCCCLGYRRDELIGQHLAMVAPRATEERLAEVWQVLRETGTWRAEAVHRRRDGTELPMEVVATYSCIDGQEYNLGFLRDISAQRRREQEMREQLDELRRWQAVTLDREDRLQELKREVNALRQRLGESPRYRSVETDSPAGATPPAATEVPRG